MQNRFDFNSMTSDERNLFNATTVAAMQSMTAGDGARMVAERDLRYDGANWDRVVASNALDMAEAVIVERRRRYGTTDV